MGKEKPRKRSKDYQRMEIEALLQFVASRKYELFGTGGKGSSKEEKIKERTWKRAAHALRAAGGQERNWQTIRKKWRDMASKAKAHAAPRTGGGPPPETNEVHDRVLAILAKEVVDGILPEDDEPNSQDSAATDVSVSQDENSHQLKPQFVAPPSQARSTQPWSLTCSSNSSSGTTRPSNTLETQRPAQIRQLEIQEELLRIQQAKLNVKQQQVQISQSILQELKNLNNTLLANQPTVMDLLISSQQS